MTSIFCHGGFNHMQTCASLLPPPLQVFTHTLQGIWALLGKSPWVWADVGNLSFYSWGHPERGLNYRPLINPMISPQFLISLKSSALLSRKKKICEPRPCSSKKGGGQKPTSFRVVGRIKWIFKIWICGGGGWLEKVPAQSEPCIAVTYQHQHHQRNFR